MSFEAWIDVGGTFTDCLVRTPKGEVLRTKTLSSARVPVSVEPISDSECTARELSGDSEGFWNGANLVGLDASGNVLFSKIVSGSSASGRLRLSQAVNWPSACQFEIQPKCEAPVLAVHRLLGIPLQQSLPELTVRLGTTRGTNSLLTRTGAKVALFVTDPFEELLLIGDQTRPDLFSLDIQKAPPLSAFSIGIVERLSADGTVLVPLDYSQARLQLQNAQQAGCDSAAVSFLHSYKNPVHEQQLESLAREFGFEHVSVSHQLATVAEYVPRTQTAVLDAYLSPIIRNYFRRLCEQFGGPQRVQLLVMTSAGGLIDWQEYSGKDCILSGPAGGVIALSSIRAEHHMPVIGLDMGGTSTDVCRVGEQPELQYESNKAGVRVLTPTLPIETVASGGGSVCWFDGVSLRVGPQSAGAYPGPACYGRGGPLTITDLNVVSGRVPESQFLFPVNLEASWSRIDQLLEEISAKSSGWSRSRLIDGLRKLANEQMAEAVRSVSTKQGVDPRQHSLIGFGGAAGQHICEIADSLGTRTIMDHADAGLLSAVGMGLARLRLDAVIPIYEMVEKIDFDAIRTQATLAIERLTPKLTKHQSSSDAAIVADCQLELRYQGTDSTLTIAFNQVKNEGMENSAESSLVAKAFSALHQQRFGYQRPTRPIEMVSLRISVQSNELRSISSVISTTSKFNASQVLISNLRSDSGQNQTLSSTESKYELIERFNIRADQVLEGPIIVLNSGSTLVIERSWQARLNSLGILCIEKSIAADLPSATCTESDTDSSFDPVLRDCFAQRLSAIATQMGHVLQQTAVSVNVKQRRDFSCAVFDSQGQLLANAPHVPVHLGAMGATVRAIREKFPNMQPGDSFLCNDPYCGGSHLLDLTFVQPVFDEQAERPAFFVANRAHHADIGGLSPGSMSIEASNLEQEGVVIAPFQFSVGQNFRLEELQQLVQQSPYPPRNWQENLADLHAQHAACLRGCQLLQEYAVTIGWSAMQAYSQHLLAAGQARIEQFFLRDLRHRTGVTQGKVRHFEDFLEDGTRICVSISLASANKLRIDFTGTGPVSATNLNANPSIVTAAVLYVLRCLVNDELPLNEGVLRAVELLIPHSVLNPVAANERGKSPAVAAGNVETSQRVVDVLLGALGVAAASQGTMNNVLFGNSTFGFYETICGGSGATQNSPGATAVHTHMTNTRLTDPEILEIRYPVRLVRFGVRKGSGGPGRNRGGDGVVRAFMFLQPVSLSLLTSRRQVGPFGIAGGGAGATGENWLQTPEGKASRLPSNCQLNVDQGTILTIQTPGGGGFGE